MFRIAPLALALNLLLLSSSCVVVGYSSSGGSFIWPGGLMLGLILLSVILWLVRSR
jgi:hypothetical protein